MHRSARPDEAVEHRVQQRVPQLGVIEVGEDRDAEAPIGDEPNDRRASLDTAGVQRDELAAVILQQPTEAVRLEARMRQRRGGREEGPLQDLLRLEQLREIACADEPPAADPAAVEQEPQPLAHVGHVREDRAGRRDVVDAIDRRREDAHGIAHDAVR